MVAYSGTSKRSSTSWCSSTSSARAPRTTGSCPQQSSKRNLAVTTTSGSPSRAGAAARTTTLGCADMGRTPCIRPGSRPTRTTGSSCSRSSAEGLAKEVLKAGYQYAALHQELRGLKGERRDRVQGGRGIRCGQAAGVVPGRYGEY